MKTKNNILVVCTEKRFALNHDNTIINEDNTRSYQFWKRYLDVFDKVIVVARVNSQLNVSCTNEVEGEGVEVYPLTNFQGLKEGLLKYRIISKELNTLVSLYADCCFLLRAPGGIANQLGDRLIKNKIKFSLEIVGDPFEVYGSQTGFLFQLLARKERYALKKLLRYASNAAYVTKKELQSKYPFNGNYQTYYSSINLKKDFFYEDKTFLRNPQLKLIGVGNVEMPYKGVRVLLEALKILKDKGIQFSLEWIGDGKLLAEYIDFCKGNNLDNSVSFLGRVPNESIPTLLNKNNIFIMPSLTEGLPRALIEAMSGRMICLGSNVGGIPELLDDKCLFETNNQHSLAEKLIEVDKKFDEFKKYSDINYNVAKEYLPEVLKVRRNKFLEEIKSRNEN